MKQRAYGVERDPVIQALRAEGEADPDVLGIVLTGSRALGAITGESDYDAAFIVTDEAMDRYEQEGRAPAHGHTVDPPITTNDIWNQSIRTLRPEHMEAWDFQTWADARVINDRTGEIPAVIDALRRMPEEQAPEAIANGMYHSLKAWRRGDELGGRLEAAGTVERGERVAKRIGLLAARADAEAGNLPRRPVFIQIDLKGPQQENAS